MKSSALACAGLSLLALAGCRSNGDNMFVSQQKTVEYYRVFDIKTNASQATVAQAASDGFQRSVKDAVVATPAGVQVGAVPGRFRMADPAAPGSAPATPASGPTCEGASWTAKGSPSVHGGDNLNVVACLFPYSSGYHLDMYAVFTRPDGGLLAWPRRLGGAVLGTPEKFTEDTMMDLVRAIRDGTGANVALVEARPELAGASWMGAGPGNAKAAPAPAPAPAVAATPAPAPAAIQGTAPGPASTATPDGLR